MGGNNISEKFLQPNERSRSGLKNDYTTTSAIIARCVAILESSARYGYRINEDVSEKSDLEPGEHIPQTSGERCKYIIEKLFFNKWSFLRKEIPAV